MIEYWTLNPPRKKRSAKGSSVKKKTKKRTRASYARAAKKAAATRKRNAAAAKRSGTAKRKAKPKSKRKAKTYSMHSTRVHVPKKYKAKRRKNPPKRKRRKNPGSYRPRSIKSQIKSLWSRDSLTTAAVGAVGFGAALALPGMASKALRLDPRWSRGWYGVGFSALSSVAAGSIAGMIGGQKAAKAVSTGALIATGVRAVMQALPSATVRKLIPLQVLASAGAAPAAARPALPLSRVKRLPTSGQGDYLYPAGVGDYLGGGQEPSVDSYAPWSSGGESF